MEAFAVADNIIHALSDLVTSPPESISNFIDDFKMMMDKVSFIRAVLRDAEHKFETQSAHKDWEVSVKAVLSDVDDFLDEFFADDSRREVISKTRMTLRFFFCHSNQVAFRPELDWRKREIEKTLSEIDDLTRRLPKLSDNDREQRQTDSVIEDQVIGREEEKKLIVDQVIGREEEKKLIVDHLIGREEENISVISIVGIGGLGKTALAQLVYHDKAVQSYFDPKMWVHGADNFDVKQIAQRMVGQALNSNEIMKQAVRNKIKGKRFLLILDGVWNDDRKLWDDFKSWLTEGAVGSKIIVTTRNNKVANVMSTRFSISLRGLDEETSLKLFFRKFVENDEVPTAKMIDIGKDIVRKCAGVPHAITTIGSCYVDRSEKGGRFIGGEYDIELFKANVPANCEGLLQGYVFSSLRLSYDHLPPHLKNCFAYCSLFPKDCVMQKETLIRLWVAQGYIQPTEDKSSEDFGVEYFMELLARSFFQDVDADCYGDISTCKMHYLIHDLAVFVAGEDYIFFKGKDERMRSGTRHVSFGFELESDSSIPTSWTRRSNVRTFLLPCQSIPDYGLLSLHISSGSLVVPQEEYRLSDFISSSLTSSLKRSRVLDLHHLNILTIPESIGELKHLRYLNLSSNVHLKKLPQTITRLHYLQTLKLSHCLSLQELPRDIDKLVHLRHLEIDDCISLTCMPRGLGKLTSLRTLSQFVVGNRQRNSSAKINELAGMNGLRGSLFIRGLKNLRGDFDTPRLLEEKEHLRELELIWPSEVTRSNFEEEFAEEDEAILQCLEPRHTIKRLRIEGFAGTMLPNWIADLSLLQELAIHSCKNLVSLPETMHQLPSLEKLIITRCPLLKQRYQREKGKEWPKIAHIPHIICV